MPKISPSQGVNSVEVQESEDRCYSSSLCFDFKVNGRQIWVNSASISFDQCLACMGCKVKITPKKAHTHTPNAPQNCLINLLLYCHLTMTKQKKLNRKNDPIKRLGKNFSLKKQLDF